MINTKGLNKLADLSRVELTQEEKGKIIGEFENILGYVSEIQKISTNDPKQEDRIGLVKNVMREDENSTESGVNTEVIMYIAPKKKNGYFVVKKIL